MLQCAPIVFLLAGTGLLVGYSRRLFHENRTRVERHAGTPLVRRPGWPAVLDQLTARVVSRRTDPDQLVWRTLVPAPADAGRR